MAYAIKDGLEADGLKVEPKKPQEATEDDFYGYDWFVWVRLRLSGNLQNPSRFTEIQLIYIEARKN